MKCNNPYCPVKFDAFKEPCLDCEHRIEDNHKWDLPEGFEELLRGNK